MGCTIRCIREDHCRVQTFGVATDNAANMKCAFTTMEVDPALNSDESVCIDYYESNSESIVQNQPSDADEPLP